MFDAKPVMMIVGTCAIGACAVILTLRGDVTHASTFAALLVPSLGQLMQKKEVQP